MNEKVVSELEKMAYEDRNEINGRIVNYLIGYFSSVPTELNNKEFEDIISMKIKEFKGSF